MSHPFRFLGFALLVGSTAAYAYAAPPNYVGSSQQFSVEKTAEVPGGTLKPGDYTIRILDQLSDRMIVRVDKADGKQHAIFLAVPHGTFPDTSGSGPSDWRVGAEGVQALRGFEFSNGATVEFVYPKAEAAALATKNAAQVVAIDPDSEGRPKLTKMSPDDMKVVTLWMLTLTTASPGSKTPALQAQRYTEAENGGNVVTARNTPAPALNAAQSSTSTQSSTPSQGPTSRQDVARLEQPAGNPQQSPVTHRHVVSQLPHTASNLPLIWLMGLLSSMAAAMVRVIRMAVGQVK